MKFILIAFICLSPWSVVADNSTKDEIKNFCLNDISQVLKVNASSSIETKLYQKIFLDESEAFCSCMDKAFKDESRILGISLYFIDPELRFTKEDHCRHANYKEGTFEVSTMLAHKKLQEIIQDRIHDYYIKGVWLLASQESIARKFICVEEKVKSKCLKTGAGGISYHCILHTMTNGSVMGNLDDECPSFETVNYISPLI
jgi:hypothetical protein